MGNDEFLYVNHERVRGLITAMTGSADTLATIHTDQNAAAVATAVEGTGVGAACSAGALSSATAIEGTAGQVRTMATNTTTGLSTVTATDEYNAGQIPQGN